MYIQITTIDAETKILCTEAPMQTGPAFPEILGWEFVFDKQSDYPIATNPDGSYVNPPLYYGTCNDDADITVAGVIKVLTEEEFNADREAEHQSRKPCASWVGDINTMTWHAPIPYPADGKQYYWDEPLLAWVEPAMTVNPV